MSLSPQLLEILLPRLGGHDPLIEQYSRALVVSPPIDWSKGGYIAQIKAGGGKGSTTVLRKIGVIH